MARKNESPQKAAMREMMRDYLKNIITLFTVAADYAAAPA